jgi:thiosulfate/3-mercaptopyruvate sulfurtransferase
VLYQFVDCRWELEDPARGHELYLAGHIPGASFLAVDADLSDLSVQGAGRHPLPGGDHFGEAAGRAGIGPAVLVVAYGNMGGAERLWWLLRHFGHDGCAVLEGGLESWQGPLRAGEESVEPRDFRPRERADDIVDADELRARLGEEGLLLVDTRTPARYAGEPNELDRPPGRIPGAVNVPYTEPALSDELLQAREIVAYCGSGVTACVDLLALTRAGRPDAKLYPGSYSDWSARGLPTETG